MVETIALWMKRRRAVRRRFNPYIAGAPVFDRQLFFGRGGITRRALRLMASRSVRITGERRIGKTSFLHHLRDALAAEVVGERRSFPVFVDLEAVSRAGLFRALMDDTVDAVGLTPDARPGLLWSRTRGEYGACELRADLARLLQGLGALEGRPVRLVFLIDEVDAVLGGRGADADWLTPLLEAFPTELRFVLSGVAPAVSRYDGAWSGLDRLVLAPLTREAAERLIRKPVYPVYVYDAAAVDRILALSGLRPFPIQRLCLHAVNRMLDEGRTTILASDVAGALDSARALEGRPRAAFGTTEHPHTLP